MIESRKTIAQKEEKSALIEQQLVSFCFSYQVIALYAATDDEVNLDYLTKQLLDANKIVCFPRVDDNELRFYRINNLDELKITSKQYHIREPITNDAIDKDDIELVIAPGVGFDIKKNRLGMGKGFYDKYLFTSKSYKIGVCFDELLLDEIPHTYIDISMNLVVSDKRIID